MQVLASAVLAVALAAPDPRTIDPDSVQPEIVTDGEASGPVIPRVPPPDTPPPTTTTPPPTTTTPPPTTTTPPPTTTTPPPTTTTPPPTTTTPLVEPEPESEPEPDVDRTQGCFPARGRCRRLSIAGFSTLGAGVALLATGIAFMQVAPFPIDDEPAFLRSLEPPGKALIAVGVGALLSGALLVGSGFAVHKKFQSGEEKLARRRGSEGGSWAKRVRVDARGLHW